MATLRIYDINSRTGEITDDERYQVSDKEDALLRTQQALSSSAESKWLFALLEDFKGQDSVEKVNYELHNARLLTRVEYLDD